MPNQRKPGLVHIGAWVDDQTEEDLRVIAHCRVSDKSKVLVEILAEQLKRELKRLPVAMRSHVRKALREQKNSRNGKSGKG